MAAFQRTVHAERAHDAEIEIARAGSGQRKGQQAAARLGRTVQAVRPQRRRFAERSVVVAVFEACSNMQEPANAGPARGGDQSARRRHIGRDGFLQILFPVVHAVGGGMDDGIRPDIVQNPGDIAGDADIGHGPPKTVRTGRKALQTIQIGTGAMEGDRAESAGRQDPDDVRSEEPGGAGDKHLHVRCPPGSNARFAEAARLAEKAAIWLLVNPANCAAGVPS